MNVVLKNVYKIDEVHVAEMPCFFDTIDIYSKNIYINHIHAEVLEFPNH